MIGFTIRFQDETRKVRKAADDASFKNLGHAAATIRKTARGLIRTSRSYAKPGDPVHTRYRRLPNAIVYDVSRSKLYAVIGPARSLTGPVGGAHEHGGVFRGDHYEPRPFMGPALNRNLARLAAGYSGSVGG